MLISLTHSSSMICLDEHFPIGLLVFFLLSLDSSLFSEYHPLMKIYCENISCHSVACLFHSLNSIFHKASIFTFDEIFYSLLIVL